MLHIHIHKTPEQLLLTKQSAVTVAGEYNNIMSGKKRWSNSAYWFYLNYTMKVQVHP